jgi:endogenous inhibitor of DNA gyrase (YacG/DUF329 family)
MTDWPCFPFCSKKCKLIDMGRWLDDSYLNKVPVIEREDIPEDLEEE